MKTIFDHWDEEDARMSAMLDREEAAYFGSSKSKRRAPAAALLDTPTLKETPGGSASVPALCSSLSGAEEQDQTRGTPPEPPPSITEGLIHEQQKRESAQENRQAGPSESVHPSHSLIRLADEIDWIEQQLRKYVSLPHKKTDVLVALWVVNTYTFQNFPYAAYLSLQSATPQCGKSRLLGLIGSMSYGNPQPTTMPSAAVLYRGASKVILLDEVDRLRNQDRDMYGNVIAVLNAGFEESGKVERMTKTGQGSYEVESFNVYGPKAFAGLESLADTIASRSLTLRMERATERKPRLNMRVLGPEFAAHRTRLEEWAKIHGPVLQAMHAALPNSLPALQAYPDRLQDIVEPLYLLAQQADQERPEGPLVLPRLLSALGEVYVGQEVSGRERGLQAILDLADMYLQEVSRGSTAFISSQELLINCQATEELSWIRNTSALAKFLKLFGLAPRSNGEERGYTFRREWVGKMRTLYPRPA